MGPEDLRLTGRRCPILDHALPARAQRTTWLVAGLAAAANLASFVLSGSVVGDIAAAVFLGVLVRWCAGLPAGVRIEERAAAPAAA